MCVCGGGGVKVACLENETNFENVDIFLLFKRKQENNACFTTGFFVGGGGGVYWWISKIEDVSLFSEFV